MSELKTTVSALITNESDHVLLVQEGFDGPYNLPGGGLKARETWLDAVVREAKEESGLLVRPDYFVGIYQCVRTKAHTNLTRLVVACTMVDGELTPSQQHPEVDFFSDKEIKGLRRDGQLQNGGLWQAVRDYRRGKGIGLDILVPVKKHKK